MIDRVKLQAERDDLEEECDDIRSEIEDVEDTLDELNSRLCTACDRCEEIDRLLKMSHTAARAVGVDSKQMRFVQ